MKYKTPAPRIELTPRQIQLAQGIYYYLVHESSGTEFWDLFQTTQREVQISDAKTAANLWQHLWKLQNEWYRFEVILRDSVEFPVRLKPAFIWWLYLRFSWSQVFKAASGLYDALPQPPAPWPEIKMYFRKLESAYFNYLNALPKQDLLVRECWQKGVQPWLIELVRPIFSRGERESVFVPEFSEMISLRVNSLKMNRNTLLEIMKKEDREITLSRRCSGGLTLPIASFFDLAGSPGRFEIQDEISQLLLELCPVEPGGQVWDVWSETGANALALAGLMKNQGRIFVTNLRRDVAAVFSEQATHAGISIFENSAETVPKCDWVWLAAPNSQTGLLRTNPLIKARLTEPDFNERLNQQQWLLEQAATGVKPGGWLAYATQSVLPRENDLQIENFLRKHPEFEVIRISSALLENYPNKCWTHYGFTTFPLIRKVTAQYLSLLKMRE